MKVTVIGTGFVGVVTAAVLARNHSVVALDIDKDKIESLKQGKVPFFEPGLEDLVERGIKNGSLEFSTSYKESIPNSEVIILAVGTPSASDGTADLRYVIAASESVAKYINQGSIVVIKSTVPPGTNDLVRSAMQAKTKNRFFVASMPEFLKEGTAVKDTLYPDRIVIGAGDKEVIDKLLELHQGLDGKRVIVSPESAQMAKYAANAYLAQRITFVNQIANLCEKNEADVDEVVDVIGADKRIGSHYWYPGLGYGGSCFPKDVKELAAYSRSVGEGDGLFVKLDELNEARIPRMMNLYGEKVGGMSGKKVAILGLSFKPNTDDMREAPSLKVVPWLIKQGASVSVYDPKVSQVAKDYFADIRVAVDAYDAVEGAEVLILLTEWEELVNLDLKKLKKRMSGSWFIDTRNQYEKTKVEQNGFLYIGVGKQ